jgi:hypothetical protein
MGLQQNGSVTIPLNKFAAGIYMVELTTGDRKTTKGGKTTCQLITNGKKSSKNALGAGLSGFLCDF